MTYCSAKAERSRCERLPTEEARDYRCTVAEVRTEHAHSENCPNGSAPCKGEKAKKSGNKDAQAYGVYWCAGVRIDAVEEEGER